MTADEIREVLTGMEYLEQEECWTGTYKGHNAHLDVYLNEEFIEFQVILEATNSIISNVHFKLSEVTGVALNAWGGYVEVTLYTENTSMLGGDLENTIFRD